MYFTDQETDRSQKLHFTLFPHDAESLFPNLVRNGNDFLYTTFTGEAEGFKPLSIDFEKENQDLIKRYYNRQIGITPYERCNIQMANILGNKKGIRKKL